MTFSDIVQIIDEKSGISLLARQPSALDPFLVVAPLDWPALGKFLIDEPRLHLDMLNCITVVDYLETDASKVAKCGFEPHLEVVYHLSSFTHQHRLVVKILLPRWKDNIPNTLPEVPTVCHIWPAANWHERECFDLGGVCFTGHPDLTRILMAEDWVGHPLRKDYEYPLEYQGIRCR